MVGFGLVLLKYYSAAGYRRPQQNATTQKWMFITNITPVYL